MTTATSPDADAMRRANAEALLKEEVHSRTSGDPDSKIIIKQVAVTILKLNNPPKKKKTLRVITRMNTRGSTPVSDLQSLLSPKNPNGKKRTSGNDTIQPTKKLSPTQGLSTHFSSLLNTDSTKDSSSNQV